MSKHYCTISHLAVLLLLSVSVLPCMAQQDEPVTAQRFEGTIRMDGLSSEPAWENIRPFLPVQYEPDNGAQPTERTEFRVAYDDDYLYLSLRAYDSDPTGIRANTLYRDRLSGDDHFEILIDTFNDNETGLLFTTTPAGIRRDAAVSNDASGGGIASGGWLNVNFNTYWDVATTINEEGWFAEMRIPFSSLRFQEDSRGRVVMGITMQRKVARKTERLVFPAVRPVANFAFLKPSLAQKIVFEDIRSQQPAYLTPYALAGLGLAAVPNVARTGYHLSRDMKREIGGDLKYSLSNSLTLDLTINTDFAQVEADDQQINLTRFSLFFPEKRQFFQERAGIFDFRTGQLSRLFHSRRIGLTEDGSPVRLLGGARLVGRFGPWDLGLLNMQTAEHFGDPSENFGVLRARRQILNPYSYAGGMFTSRVGVNGAYNFAYGLDSVIRLFRDDYLTLQWAHSFDGSHRPADFSTFSSGRFTAELTRRTREGWGYGSSLAWSGPYYDPGLGFSQRNDFTLLDNALSYTWLQGPVSPLIFHAASLRGSAFLRNQDGSLESMEAGPEWELSARSGESASIGIKMLYEDLLRPFSIADGAVVPAGSYRFYRVDAGYRPTHTGLFQLRPDLTAGTFYDGWQVTMALTPIWYVSRHLEFAGAYQYSRVRFPDRDQQFDAHLMRLRIGTALNTKVSLNAFLQYNSARNAASANIRFRYNFREGNDLWIVYNEGLNTDRDRFDPALLLVDNRTFLVKYTHTMRL